MEGLQLGDLKDHKLIFLTETRSYRKDRYDKLKCEKNRVFGNENNKEKHLEKSQDRSWNKDQKPIPNYSLFLWIFQHFKTNKDQIF